MNERVKLEVRADATNLTNTPSFAAPTTDITSSIFGRIRNTRIEQFAQDPVGRQDPLLVALN